MGSGGNQRLQAAVDDTVLKTTVAGLGACVALKDTQARYTYVNASYLVVLGGSACVWQGKTDLDLLPSNVAPGRHTQDMQLMADGQSWAGEEVFSLAGDLRTYWVVKKPLLAPDSSVIGLQCVLLDITVRKRREKELADRRDLLAFILDNVNSYIYMKDEHRRYHYVNKKTADDFEITPEEMIGKTDLEVMYPEEAEIAWNQDVKVFERNERHVREDEFVNPDGTLRHYWTESIPFQYTPDCRALLGVATDISELHNLKEELKRQTMTDALTGAFNRRHFFEVAERSFARALRYHEPISMLIFDIDFFKSINDNFGHPAGDAVLREVADKCKTIVRDVDVFARIGGEEFAVLLPQTPNANANSVEVARALAERIRLSLGALVITGDWEGAIQPTVSVGVATRVPEDSTFSQLYERADHALYTAKHSGRNQVVFE